MAGVELKLRHCCLAVHTNARLDAAESILRGLQHGYDRLTDRDQSCDGNRPTCDARIVIVETAGRSKPLPRHDVGLVGLHCLHAGRASHVIVW